MSVPGASEPIGPDSSGSGPASPGGAGSGPSAPGTGTARRRRIIAALLTVVLVAGIAVAALLFSRPADTSATSATQSAQPTETPTATETTPPPVPAPAPPPPPEPIPELQPVPMNILIIGSDSRGNARDQAGHTLATGQQSDQRADTIMVAHVPADRRSVQVVSIMRDTWVNIPSYGGSKVNTSLQVGGTPLVKQTVESLLGLHIDHTLMLDFNGFRALIDAMGGIDVQVNLPFQSTHDTGHVFSQGLNRLNGQASLEFVRERYAFIDGDYQRVRNQQAFLQALLAKLTHGGALNDPNVVRHLVALSGPWLTLNQGHDALSVAILAYGLRNLDYNACTFVTLPTAGVGTIGGASVVLPDYGGINAVAAALREGRLAQYAAGR
ncbi:LCP family protein [Arthrobacter sp. D1-29]